MSNRHLDIDNNKSDIYTPRDNIYDINNHSPTNNAADSYDTRVNCVK